jgi:hypothetical protein
MRRRIGWTAAAVLVSLPVTPAVAQEQFYYPTKGQSAQTQQKDKYECYDWAKGQSGFDPMAAPTPTSPRPKGGGGGENVLGGALLGAGGGAAVGAIGGAIAGHGKAGKGAAIGSVAGGLLGVMGAAGENEKESRKRKEWEQQQASQYAGNRNNYNRAFAACMQGRGYTVN